MSAPTPASFEPPPDDAVRFAVRARWQRSRQSGFSMLEVLVSIVILCIGALGAAGMQLTAMKDSGSAAYRYRAASLASAMIDTLRTERSEAIAGTTGFTSALGAGTCAGNATTPVARWLNQVACELPSGKGSVAIEAYTKRALVTVQWNDSRGTQGASAQTFTLEGRL